MIIIAGCSWACGEWQRGDISAKSVSDKILHEGLTQYVREAGEIVLNLGIPGGSNYAIANKLNSWFERNTDHQVKKIFIFQTDYARDYQMVFNEDFDNINQANTLASIMISRFYYRLIEISKKYNVKICLIGGVSDTLSPEILTSYYAPLEVVCQSMVNLLVKGNHLVEDPVLSWYPGKCLPMVETIKKKLSADQILLLLHEINKGFERENLVFSTPEYFWPDGTHPNRNGHKKLFDYLVENNYLQLPK